MILKIKKWRHSCFLVEDFLNKKCNLYLSIIEEDHDHEALNKNESAHLVMKVDYTTRDGHSASPAESDLYQYNENTGTYFDVNQPSDETRLVALSIALKNGDKPDPNKLDAYLSNSTLKQFIRVSFNKETDNKLFMEELESILETNSPSSDQLNKLNKVTGVMLGMAHGDHYHTPVCTGFKTSKVVETNFEQDSHDDHGDDDHDHDHDH